MPSNSDPMPFKPDRIIEIAVRRRWFIILPLFVATLVGIYLTFTLPRIYEAQTLILIQPQRVPDDFVRSVISVDLNARLATIKQQILSRTNLEKIIEQFNLFQDESDQKLFIEDKIAGLRKQISVDFFSDQRNTSNPQSAFSISYRGEDPARVMRIANTLANYFIDENYKVREKQAVGTSVFLEEGLADLRTRLNELEEQLKAYRQAHMGELPEQLESNLSILQRLQEQATSKQESLRDIKLRLSQLENQRIIEESASQTEDQRVVTDWNNLAQLKNTLASLKMRYTEQHPDVIRLQKRIQELEAQYSPEKPAPPADPLAVQKMELSREKFKLEQEIAQITYKINMYQQRVENTPKREQELLALKRDYDNMQKTYDNLLNRKMEADLSLDMERKQQGEQFQILDPARLPTKPIRPDLKKLFLMTVVIGLGIGCGVVYLLEYTDDSFRAPNDVENLLELPVLAIIPESFSRSQQIRKLLNRTLSIASAIVTLLMISLFAYIALYEPNRITALIRTFIRT